MYRMLVARVQWARAAERERIGGRARKRERRKRKIVPRRDDVGSKLGLK